MFAREVDSNETMQTAIADVIFLKINGEKGEGPEIAKKYGVKGWPSFAAVNGNGEPIDRWIGYAGPEVWSATVDRAKADRRTLVEKKAAYETEPTLGLALSLAGDSATDFDFGTSVGYLRKARELDPDNAAGYNEDIVTFMSYGLRGGAFTFEDIDEEARAAIAHEGATTEQIMKLSLQMSDMAARMGMADKAIPYLEAGMKASEGSEDEGVVGMRAYLEPEYALRVEKDVPKAFDLKLKNMDEGWQENTNALNDVAWWCFENDHNLEQALEWALKGVELAGSDREKANVLDTAAELCNSLGDCDEAIAKIKLALELNPDDEYLTNQLTKFQKIAEEKKG